MELTRELQRSRQQMLTSREEERRRMRRDLHDGLGPALAAIAMQADTAQALADSDPGRARELMAAVTRQARDVVGDVRRLVYELRPPSLDELGLLVLGLIAQGYNNTQIADHLVLSPKTVRNYVTSIFAKLQVADRAQAIVRARDAGMR